MRVTATATLAGGNPGASVTATATCPAGKTLLGGGGSVTNSDTTGDNPARVQMSASRPASGNSTTAWEVTLVEASVAPNVNATLTANAYAICG